MASAFLPTQWKRIVQITKHWVRSADLSRGPGLNMNDERRAGWSWCCFGIRQVKISSTVPASCTSLNQRRQSNKTARKSVWIRNISSANICVSVRMDWKSPPLMHFFSSSFIIFISVKHQTWGKLLWAFTLKAKDRKVESHMHFLSKWRKLRHNASPPFLSLTHARTLVQFTRVSA